jgi:tRNA-specific 2-thiouridylase
LPLYTIGQRRGLHISAGQPLYVTGFDPDHNAVVVGPAIALERDSLEADRVTFVNGVWPTAAFNCTAQIRSHATPTPARVTPLDAGRIHVQFERPQRAISPGQAVVLYDDLAVLGGGQIVAE